MLQNREKWKMTEKANIGGESKHAKIENEWKIKSRQKIQTKRKIEY